MYPYTMLYKTNRAFAFFSICPAEITNVNVANSSQNSGSNGNFVFASTPVVGVVLAHLSYQCTKSSLISDTSVTREESIKLYVVISRNADITPVKEEYDSLQRTREKTLMILRTDAPPICTKGSLAFGGANGIFRKI